MEPYVSHAPWRRECWKGHDSPEGVRRTIRHARGHRVSLRLYRQGTDADGALFVEIQPADWDRLFFPSAGT